MSDEKIKDFFQKMEKVKKNNELIAETIKIKRENINNEIGTVSQLEGYHRRQEYILRMYEDVPTETINKMSGDEYSTIATVINSTVVSGEAAFYLHDESQKTSPLYQQHFDTASSLVTLAGTNSINMKVISLDHPDWFPNGESINHEYQIKDEIDQQIKSIADQLQNQFPDIKNDFDSFIRKFNAFRTDKSQYQDLIGGRSLFFFKMIFDFSKQSYGVEFPRLESIKKFVFGSATPISSTEPILQDCNNLYREMSDQESSGMSIKLGMVTSSYIKSLFRRLISNIATILKLRGQYFQS